MAKPKPKTTPKPLGAATVLAVVTFALFLVYRACGHSDRSPPEPIRAHEEQPAPPSGPGCEPTATPVYTKRGGEDAGYPGHPRISVRISVPRGLSREELTANLCRAALDASHGAGSPSPAVMVFAYDSAETKGAYTAGRAVYAPGGVWGDADPSVPLSRWKVVVDLEEAYFAAVTEAGSQGQLTDITDQTVSVSRKFESWGDDDIFTRAKVGTKVKILDRRTSGALTRYQVQLPDGRRGWVQSSQVKQ